MAYSAEASTVTCTHPQVCNLIKKVIQKYDFSPRPTIKLAYAPKGDPHNSSPSTGEIKTVIKSDFFIAAPIKLQPWGKSLISKKKESFIIKLNKISSNFYDKSNNLESLAHFWLYPRIMCAAYEQVFSALKKSPLFTSSIKKSLPCPYLNLEKRLQKLAVKLKDHTIISGHDATNSLFYWLGVNTINFYSSHHHGDINVKELKKIHQILKGPHEKIIWLQEAGANIPTTLLKKLKLIKKNIVFFPYGRYPNEPDKTLRELIINLEKLIP